MQAALFFFNTNAFMRGGDQRTSPSDKIISEGCWKSKLDFSYQENTGNVEQKIISGGGIFAKRFKDFSVYLKAGTAFVEQANTTIQDASYLTLRADYPSTGKWRWFVFNTHARNKFIQIKYRSLIGLGPWLQTKGKKWSHGLSLAPSYVYERFESNVVNRETRVTLRSLFHYGLNENNFIGYDLYLSPRINSFKDLQVYFSPYFEALIYKDVISLKFSYRLEYDSHPQPGVKRADQQYLTSINFYFSSEEEGG